MHAQMNAEHSSRKQIVIFIPFEHTIARREIILKAGITKDLGMLMLVLPELKTRKQNQKGSGNGRGKEGEGRRQDVKGEQWADKRKGR